jgi:peptidyl-prolyl cis-trans isomerase D
MTMLDRMRRHKGWLKWSLALVVLTFVLFYIPDFLTSTTGAAPSETVATVEGRQITVREFQRRYTAQLQAYRQAYGSQLSDQLLRQLGIEKQILQQLVDEEAMVSEARRQGISANDVEVRERILAIPAFQENGRFIGEARYRQMLQFNNPPLTSTEFEDQVRRAIVIEKLRNAATGWMSVGDDDVAQEYRRRNEKVKLDVVPITPDAFKSQITVSEADIAAAFEKKKENYRVGEKRKIKYALIDVDKVREQVKVAPADIEALYKQNQGQYQTPEQVRASHILLKIEGDNEAQVKAKAEEVLKRAKAGEDFAALAKEFSQDESNAGKGGDLDYFPRGAMVPEFETAAFAMKPGEISDLVKTSFGYHIIKVVDHKAATTRPIAEVTPEQVRASHILLKIEGDNEAQVKAKAEEVLKRVKAGEDFAALAKEFSQDESNAGKGGDLDYFPRGAMVPEFETAAFAMKPGEISDLVKTSFGYHIIKVVDHKAATTRPIAEVTPELEDQLKWQKAQAEAEQQSKALEAQMKSPADMDRIAKERGLTTFETGLFLRDEPIDGLGPSPEVAAQAFQLQPGAVGPALRVAKGWVFVTVTGKQEPYVPQLVEVHDKVRDDLVRERAAELAKSKASEIAAALKSAPDFAAAAQKAGLQVKPTELITRGSPIPDLGSSPEVDAAAFSLPKGGVSDPISTPQGTAIIRVVEKEEVTPEKITEGRDQLREELVNQRRDQFFSGYMQNAKKKLKIEIKQDVLARVIGSARG